MTFLKETYNEATSEYLCSRAGIRFVRPFHVLALSRIDGEPMGGFCWRRHLRLRTQSFGARARAFCTDCYLLVSTVCLICNSSHALPDLEGCDMDGYLFSFVVPGQYHSCRGQFRHYNILGIFHSIPIEHLLGLRINFSFKIT